MRLTGGMPARPLLLFKRQDNMSGSDRGSSIMVDVNATGTHKTLRGHFSNSDNARDGGDYQMD